MQKAVLKFGNAVLKYIYLHHKIFKAYKSIKI